MDHDRVSGWYWPSRHSSPASESRPCSSCGVGTTGRAVAERKDALPRPGSETYREMVSAFYAGVAALDVDATERAKTALTRATELVPAEPAAWADLGLLKLRLRGSRGRGEGPGAGPQAGPESGAIERLLGLLESRGGPIRRGDRAPAAGGRARARRPEGAVRPGQGGRAPGGPDSDAEALRLAGELLELRPDNLVVLLERARLAVKRGDAQALGDSVARARPARPVMADEAQELYRELEQAAKANPRSAVTRVLVLRNVLVQTPAFRQDLAAVETPGGTVGEPIETFLRLAPPPPTPSPPDDALSFAVEPMAEASTARWDTLLAVSMTGEGPPALFVADGRSVRRVDGAGVVLPFPGGPRRSLHPRQESWPSTGTPTTGWTSSSPAPAA